MEAIFVLMKLKHSHKKYKAETLPEKEKEVMFKVRWKVMGADGSPVVLQLPFKKPLLTGQEIKDGVCAFTKKKYPNLSSFTEMLVVYKIDNPKEKMVVQSKPGVEVEKMKRELKMDEEFRLDILFPGPKFEAKKIILLDCINAEMDAWMKGKKERIEKQLLKQAEDKVKREAKKKEKAEAKKNAPQKGKNSKKPVGKGRGKPKRK